MKKIVAIITFSILLVGEAKSQHCPFDNLSIIVLNIHSEEDTAIVPNLKITILNRWNKPITAEKWWKNKGLVVEPLIFLQNPSKTAFNSYIDNNHPAEPSRIRYPFAKDNYVLVVYRGFPLKKYKIKIEDIDDVGNSGHFKKVILKLTGSDLYSLCGKYELEVYPQRGYNPFEVVLQEK